MSTIQVIALKSFVYSTNGYTEIPVAEKEVIGLPERLFDGLNDARYVRRAVIGDGKINLNPAKDEIAEKVEPTVEAAVETQEAPKEAEKTGSVPVDVSEVEIPDDWRSLKFFALRSLASKLGQKAENMEKAVSIIEAELANRNKD